MNEKLKKEVLEKFGYKVRIRVCGILKKNDKILLINHKYKKDNSSFWSAPGGEILFHENAIECLKREFYEETNIKIEVQDFLCVNEFKSDNLHSIELFFKVTYLSGSTLLGTDPELNNQIITELQFFDKTKLLKMEKTIHPVIIRFIKDDFLSGFYIQ